MEIDFGPERLPTPYRPKRERERERFVPHEDVFVSYKNKKNRSMKQEEDEEREGRFSPIEVSNVQCLRSSGSGGS